VSLSVITSQRKGDQAGDIQTCYWSRYM